MKRIDVEVPGGEEALAAFAAVYDAAETGDVAAPRLAFGSIRELFSALTEERLELIRRVAAHEGLCVRRIAAVLQRDEPSVHGDVIALIDLGLLERNVDGGLRAPFDEIVIHVKTTDAGFWRA